MFAAKLHINADLLKFFRHWSNVDAAVTLSSPQSELLLFRKTMEGHSRHRHHRWGLRGGQPGLSSGQKRPEGCGAVGEVWADGWIHLARCRCSFPPQVYVDLWAEHPQRCSSPHRTGSSGIWLTLSKKWTKYDFKTTEMFFLNQNDKNKWFI